MEPQSQLIIIEIVIGGAVTKEIELLFFNPIFHLTPGTVLLLV